MGSGLVSPDYESVIETGDGTARLIVPEGAVPDEEEPDDGEQEQLEIRMEKLDPESMSDAPVSGNQQVVLAMDVNTFKAGTNVRVPTTYDEGVELWLLLPEGEESACAEGRVSVYHVGQEEWDLVEHRCETDEEGQSWAVAVLNHFSVYTLVIDQTPATSAAEPAATAAQPTAAPAPPTAPEEEDGGMALALIVVIAVAAVAVGSLFWFFALRRRRRRQEEQ